MMKKNSKAFMLLETLIVSISISGILVFLYLQFTNVNNSYIKAYNYNSVEGLYTAGDIKENIYINGKDSIYTAVNSNKFVDLTNCSSTYFNNVDYCNGLNEIANVKTVLITKNNLGDLKSLLSNNTNITKYSETIREFVYRISDQSEGYQIIVEYKDKTAAAVTLVR